MELAEIKEFTKKYLETNQCQIIESSPVHLITQLSIPVDRDLLNRPFYWMYVEKMNIDPKPAQLCLVFDPEKWDHNRRGEYLFYGSPRFSRMLESAQKQGQFVRLYKVTNVPNLRKTNSQAYIPWLGINFFVSYICDRKKDVIHYLGINLQNGEIRENFYQEILSYTWTGKLPDHHYTLSPRMTIAEAVSELEYYLQEKLEQGDFNWADDAMKRLHLELDQLNSYYETDENASEKKHRIQELVWQYHPRIEVRIVNVGLFYGKNLESQQ